MQRYRRLENLYDSSFTFQSGIIHIWILVDYPMGIGKIIVKMICKPLAHPACQLGRTDNLLLIRKAIEAEADS